ncbi:hypothetical protein [Fimbriimonas ginsengisoli]|uniref:hypothetical protein n=1 Tax=Fimbriimonas ginsengisoli TaxID=1005039 RepID=UPI00046D8C93|nr:hypothetical protein [Fimbriimonas ginsengisoli]
MVDLQQAPLAFACGSQQAILQLAFGFATGAGMAQAIVPLARIGKAANTKASEQINLTIRAVFPRTTISIAYNELELWDVPSIPSCRWKAAGIGEGADATIAFRPGKGIPWE